MSQGRQPGYLNVFICGASAMAITDKWGGRKNMRLISHIGIVVIFFGLNSVTQAALIKGNDLSQAAGVDGYNLTTDTDTGFQWLDLTLSNFRSYNDVASNFGLTGDFYGYRHATRAEILELWSHAGINWTGNFSNQPANKQGIIDLIDHVGPTGVIPDTIAYGDRTLALGWYNDAADGSNPNAPSRGSLQLFSPDPDSIEYGPAFWGCTECAKATLIEENAFSLDSSNPYTGHWLVATTVPIPGAVWLLGSGLLGLIGFSKRKKAAL